MVMKNRVGTNFIISEDTAKLVEHLEAVPPGEAISYAQLTALIGRNVLDNARGQLNYARRKLEAEKQVHFVPVYGEGLRRQTDSEVAFGGPTHVRRTRKAAERGLDRMQLATENYKKLSDEARTAKNVADACLGAIAQALRPKSYRRLEQCVNTTGLIPSYGDTLDKLK